MLNTFGVDGKRCLEVTLKSQYTGFVGLADQDWMDADTNLIVVNPEVWSEKDQRKFCEQYFSDFYDVDMRGVRINKDKEEVSACLMEGCRTLETRGIDGVDGGVDGF